MGALLFVKCVILALRTDLLTRYQLNVGGIEPRQPQADRQPFHYVELFPPDERKIEVFGCAELSGDSALVSSRK